MDEQQRIHEIFKSFREVNQEFFQTLLKGGQQHGITPVQLLVLKSLCEKPGCSLNDLAEWIQLGNSTTSGIVDRMVKAGMVIRERLETDRRAVSLQLTEAGKDIWREINENRIKRLMPLLQVSAQDRQDLLRIHGQITRILQRVREEYEQ